MRNIKEILYKAVVVGCCGLLPFGCVKEDETFLNGERHDVAVQLNIGTRAISEADGTPTDDEKTIHTLRVYAFVGGKLAGHYFTSDVEGDPHTFFMDITLYSAGEQTVDFYAVANEAAMKTAGSGTQLTENTTEGLLKNFWFTALPTAAELPALGLPMFCDKQSVKLDFEKVKENTATDSGHAGHPLLEHDKITFNLQRPMGKLGVFAAKPVGETGTLRVTGLTLLEQGTRARNYLMPQTLETLKGISNSSSDLSLAVVDGNVMAELEDNITQEERQNPARYTPVLNEPFYPFESPWGNGGNWNIPDTEGKCNVLKIDYSFDQEARTSYIYLPAIERNHYYTICCLFHNDGKITVDYVVAGWNEDPDGEYEIEFNYPVYTNPIQPENGATLAEGGQYPQPTVWANPDTDSDEGSYIFQFNIKGSEGQKWTPMLWGVLGTPDNFEIKVYQMTDGVKTYITDPDKRVASPEPYYVQVKALKSENVNREVGLGIVYTRDWSPDGSAMLLINGLTGNLKWAGSSIAEVVVIKQTDVPTTKN